MIADATTGGPRMKETIATEKQLGTGADEYELVSVVVEYDERPDQCTIYHPDSSGIERMSSWISADTASFIDLYSAR